MNSLGVKEPPHIWVFLQVVRADLPEIRLGRGHGALTGQ